MKKILSILLAVIFTGAFISVNAQAATSQQVTDAQNRTATPHTNKNFNAHGSKSKLIETAVNGDKKRQGPAKSAVQQNQTAHTATQHAPARK